MQIPKPVVFLTAAVAVCLLFSCSGGGSASTAEKNDSTKTVHNNLTEVGLRGKVKSKTRSSYDIKFGDKGALVQKSIENYNEAGNVILQAFYGSDAKLIDKVEYVYDTNQKIIECTGHDSTGAVSFNVKFKNTLKGNELTANAVYGDTASYKYTEKYDASGNTIEYTRYTGKGEIVNKIKYTFDSNNNCTEKQTYATNGELKLKNVYEYNKGNRVSNKLYNVHGNLLEEETWRYNDKGLKTEYIKNTVRQQAGNKKPVIKEVYENFDAAGNHTKETRYENDIAKYISEYQFEYYK